MTSSRQAGRTETNAAVLAEGISLVADLLLAGDPALPPEQATALDARWAALEHHLRSSETPVPLAELVARAALDSFELKCVLLALSRHIQPSVARVVEAASRDLEAPGITVGLALDRFCTDADGRALARRSFLRGGRLLTHRVVRLGETVFGQGDGLLDQRFDLTQPARRYLLGEDELGEPLARAAMLSHPAVSPQNVVVPLEHMRTLRELITDNDRHRVLADWGLDRVVTEGRALTLLFSGPSGTGKTLLAKALACELGKPLLEVSAVDLPESQGVEALLDELFAEAAMRDAVVLIDECDSLVGKGDRRRVAAFRALEGFNGLAILTTNQPELLDDALERRILYHVPFERPGAAERRQIWEIHLPPSVPFDGPIDLDTLADLYDFTGGTIKNAVLVAANLAASRATARNGAPPAITQALLEEACASQVRYALEDLTVRTTTHLRLKDIVLPDEIMRKVYDLLAACRNQAAVMNRWGFGERLVTGKGVTTLFDGPPGTGKTYCAEILAGELGRPLYRVNIPEVVSKWVGETEKHIRQIFQQARLTHAMLLFDEADSLFASRSTETRSATDRYANMEVNLLLQEIERFSGICILTTNFFGALDKALVRRIQFRVTFEEPDATQRALIWRTLCPQRADLAPDVDFAALAKRFDLTGGMIKNALLRAAYWAMDQGSPIDQTRLLAACREEYKAAGKLVREGEPQPRRSTDDRPQ